MFQRTVDGVALRFHLAGINNQNFLMRDEQTGTYWQQINGLAVSGPLAGHRLTLVFADELSFSTWKSEQPGGTVLNEAPGYEKLYAPKNWDLHMVRVPVVISFAQAGLQPRDLMLGIHAYGVSRAYRYTDVSQQKLIQDTVDGKPVLLVLAPDGKSVRAFERLLPGGGSSPQFYRLDEPGSLMMDGPTGSKWSFQGCAVVGPLKGSCLKPLEMIRDYWFDWRNYNPNTTVFGIRQQIR